jgi:hypothetical protein
MSEKSKVKAKPKLTDSERHERFKDMAKEVAASEKSADFDRAFKGVTNSKIPHKEN